MLSSATQISKGKVGIPHDEFDSHLGKVKMLMMISTQSSRGVTKM